jgi:hypothetical protein
MSAELSTLVLHTKFQDVLLYRDTDKKKSIPAHLVKTTIRAIVDCANGDGLYTGSFSHLELCTAFQPEMLMSILDALDLVGIIEYQVLSENTLSCTVNLEILRIMNGG